MTRCAGILLACATLAEAQDLADTLIGKADPYRPAGTKLFIHPSPDLKRAITSYFYRDRETFLLENGKEETRPLKFIGWKMPESVTVMLAEGDNRRRLLLGGNETTAFGDVWDAGLFENGMRLAVVVRTERGMLLKYEDRTVGPCESIELLEPVRNRPTALIQHQGQRRLRIDTKEFEVQGTPTDLFASERGDRVAWIESLGAKQVRAVIDGVPGVVCQSVHAGIHFSPNGRHVAYVTRDGDRFRGWIDGAQINSEREVMAVRVMDDATPVVVEGWRDTPKDGRPGYLGRLVVGGKPQERTLPRPVYRFEWQHGHLVGAARTDQASVIVIVSPRGEVTYHNAPGRVEQIVLAPDGKTCAYTTEAADGMYANIGGDRRGPFRKCEVFHLSFTNRFGYVMEKNHKVFVVVEDRPVEVQLAEYVSPIRILRGEMTAAVVGIFERKNEKEIWVRAVALE